MSNLSDVSILGKKKGEIWKCKTRRRLGSSLIIFPTGKRLPVSLSEMFLYTELTTELTPIIEVCHNGRIAWLDENVCARGARHHIGESW